MKTTSAPLAAHLAGSAHTIATCWLVTRTDGQVFGFTSHDLPLTIDGVVYEAALGVDRSAVDHSAGVSAGTAQALGFLNSDSITADDLLAGVWDHAAMRIFEVNWADLTMGELKQLRGWLGQVTVEGIGFQVELRGIADPLNKSIGEVLGPSCSAGLGDARCTVDLAPYTTTGTVTATTSARLFDTDLSGSTVHLTPSTTGAPDEDYFAGGLLTWTAGLNVGRRMEVKTSTAGGQVTLQLPMANAVADGDTFSISAGCPKAFAVCVSRFGNGVNFRGFKDLPGLDQIMRYGGQ